MIVVLTVLTVVTLSWNRMSEITHKTSFDEPHVSELHHTPPLLSRLPTHVSMLPLWYHHPTQLVDLAAYIHQVWLHFVTRLGNHDNINTLTIRHISDA